MLGVAARGATGLVQVARRGTQPSPSPTTERERARPQSLALCVAAGLCVRVVIGLPRAGTARRPGRALDEPRARRVLAARRIPPNPHPRAARTPPAALSGNVAPRQAAARTVVQAAFVGGEQAAGQHHHWRLGRREAPACVVGGGQASVLD